MAQPSPRDEPVTKMIFPFKEKALKDIVFSLILWQKNR
jgi:hypothetical protein